MAFDILRSDSEIRHSPIHDVESLLYILIWISCVQGGPHRQSRKDDFKTEKTFLHKWCPFKQVDDRLLDLAADAKELMMNSENKFMQECRKTVHPYFNPLIPYFASLRALLFPAETVTINLDALCAENKVEDFLADDKREWNGELEVRNEMNEPKIESLYNRPCLADVMIKVQIVTLKYRRDRLEVEENQAAKAKLKELECEPAALLDASSLPAEPGPVPADPGARYQANTDPITVARSQINGMKLRNIQRVNYGPYAEFMKAKPEAITTTRQPLPRTVPHSATPASPALKSAGKRTLEGAFGRADPDESEASTKRLRSAADDNGAKPAENAP